MSRFPLRTLSNMSAWPRSTSAAAWTGVAPIGTTLHPPRLCRSSASIDAGGPDGGFHPWQPLASTSNPRYAVRTLRVIIVHLLVTRLSAAGTGRGPGGCPRDLGRGYWKALGKGECPAS